MRLRARGFPVGTGGLFGRSEVEQHTGRLIVKPVVTMAWDPRPHSILVVGREPHEVGSPTARRYNTASSGVKAAGSAVGSFARRTACRSMVLSNSVRTSRPLPKS